MFIIHYENNDGDDYDDDDDDDKVRFIRNFLLKEFFFFSCSVQILFVLFIMITKLIKTSDSQTAR